MKTRTVPKADKFVCAHRSFTPEHVGEDTNTYYVLCDYCARLGILHKDGQVSWDVFLKLN